MNISKDLHRLLQGKELLIFDFDGTIVNTSPLHAAAFGEVLSSLGIGVDYATIAGLKTLDAMQKCLNEAAQFLPETVVNELVVAKQERVREMIALDLQPLPGVDDFLRWARKFYRLAMYTSGSHGTVSLSLEKLSYTGWFDPLICANHIHKAKPDPEGFLKVLEMTGCSANKALVIEDSEVGFEAARCAGLDYIDIIDLLVHYGI
jgi:HAD superfamily hydrolase (TIGR01509 family)